MRVFHGPVNYASAMSARVNALREMGLTVYAYCLKENGYSDNEGVRVFQPSSNRFLTKIRKGFFNLGMDLSMLRSDVIHWYGFAKGKRWNLRFKILKWMRKALLVEWLGSDIRKSSVEAIDNEFFMELSMEDIMKHANDLHSKRRQLFMRKHAFVPIVSSGMIQYIDSESKHYILELSLETEKYECKFPDPKVATVKIMHAPSKKSIKGSKYIESALERLKAEGMPLEYRIINGIPRAAALKEIADCDIFIDQIILGDKGMSSLEAMAFGKPVVCYLKPSIMRTYSNDCPIVNANPNTIYEVLKELILDRERRTRLGREGRAYVEERHSFGVTGHKMVDIYKSELSRIRGEY